MRSAFITDDFYLCLSKVDLEHLSSNRKETYGYILFHKDLFMCKVKVLENKSREIIFNLNDDSSNFILPKEVMKEITEYGTTMRRIGDSNFYVVSELHNPEEFSMHSSTINSFVHLLVNQPINTDQ